MREERYREAEQALWAEVGVDPAEHWVTMRSGPRIRVLELGDGPPVLLIHGGTVAAPTWAPLLPHLTGRRLLVVDRPGCGLSEPYPRPARDLREFEARADAFVGEVLDALGVDRAAVVATSMGGLLGLRSAAATPERIDRLVEIAWTMGAPIAETPKAMRMAAIPGLQALTSRIPPTRGVVRMMLRQIGLGPALDDGRFSDTMVDWFRALLRYTPTMRNELRHAPKIVTTIAGLNRSLLLDDELLARVEVPALFVWGADDPMGGEQTAREFVDRLPAAKLELLDDTGHAPWVDSPERVGRLVQGFLADASE